MHEPIHLDLFSGIGGFALAAQWAGFRTIGFSEVDPYCCAVLRKHWPEVPNFGDMRRANFECFAGQIDLLTAGVPCQPASLAGKRRGRSDDRWLWPAALAVLAAVRPAIAVFENPCGILALESGLVFEELLSAMEAIGYAVQSFNLPAVAKDACHERKRIWIVANLGCGRRGESQAGQGELAGRAEAFGAGKNGTASNAAPKRQAKLARRETLACCAGRRTIGGSSWPDFDPGLLRVVHGLSNRVDRIGALGNAIVPQVAFEILKAVRTLIEFPNGNPEALMPGEQSAS